MKCTGCQHMRGKGFGMKFMLGKFAAVKFMLAGLLLFGFLLLGQMRVHAWSAGGHMTVAGIAFDELSPATQQKSTALLRHHPSAHQWLQQYRPRRDPAVGRYLFMRASLWPDEIRRSGNPIDHPDWHYVDYPLTAPYAHIPIGVPRPQPANDILTGIHDSIEILGDGTAAEATRAAYLSWLIHLIGDIHQPLHCASLINSTTYPAPEGDRGGNSFFIRPAQQAVKLHSFWDRLLGTSSDSRRAMQSAIFLHRTLPRVGLHELRTSMTPEKWSLDSCRIALNDVYLHNRLPGSNNPAAAPPSLSGPLANDPSLRRYTTRAAAIAQQQVALAGYRLADTLTVLLP